MEWQPIETAPHGPAVLLAFPREVTCGVFVYDDENGEHFWAHWNGHSTPDYQPTHWMPLPPPPVTSVTPHST